MAFVQAKRNDSILFLNEAKQHFPAFLDNIRSRLRSHLIVNALFWILASIELLFFLSSLLTVALSKESAFLLALFFATLFSYLMLRLYLAAKREEIFKKLAHQFLDTIRPSAPTDSMEYFLAIASMAKRGSNWLEGKEAHLFEAPSWLKIDKSWLEKINTMVAQSSCLRLSEMLTTLAVEYTIRAVKLQPTHLEPHMQLATAYVALSELYAQPRFARGWPWTVERFDRDQRAALHLRFVHLALEEFKILSEYAPHDPWVHEQLATSYERLNMVDQQIQEYELLLRLKEEPMLMLKLGKLYLNLGKNAKAMRIYERLQPIDPVMASELIQSYGEIT